jgi:polar amino acid transport system substrate-binding protein
MAFINFDLKKNFNFFISLFLCIFILFPNTIKSESLEIDVTADEWPPFRIIEGDKYSGIDFDLLEEVSKRMNLKLVVKQYPWSRGLINMRLGNVDIMSGLAKTKQRALFLDYTTPSYYKCSTVFYVKKGNANLIQTYDDLKKYNIGFVTGSAYFSPFDTDASLKKYSVTTEEQLIKMLLYDRFKVIIGTDCQADYDIARLGLSHKFEKANYRPGNNVDLYIGISKKSHLSKELEKINKIIQDIINEGKIQEYAKKYYK